MSHIICIELRKLLIQMSLVGLLLCRLPFADKVAQFCAQKRNICVLLASVNIGLRQKDITGEIENKRSDVGCGEERKASADRRNFVFMPPH